MDTAAINALAYWTAVCWLGGFAVSSIVKMLLPPE